MNFNLSIENIPVPHISLDKCLAQSRISPLFFALNSILPQPNSGDTTSWLSLTARYNNQAYTTFLEFTLDYGLPPTIDVVLGADFHDKCRTNMPMLTAVYPGGHELGDPLVVTPFQTCISGVFSILMKTAAMLTSDRPITIAPVTIGTLPVCSSLVFRGGAYDTPPPSSEPRGGPDVVPSPSSMSRGGIGAVASLEVDPMRMQHQQHPQNIKQHPHDINLVERPFEDNSMQPHFTRVNLMASSLSLPGMSSDVENDYPVALTLAEKNAVVQFVVNSRVSVTILRQMCSRHEGIDIRVPGAKRKSAAQLRSEFLAHTCTKACLILKSEAVNSGIPSATAVSEVEQRESTLLLNVRSSTRVNEKRRRSIGRSDKSSNKHPRASVESSTIHSSFPIILPQSEKDQIIREFRESTNNRAMKRYECSFCGKLELADEVKMRPVKSLNISLLKEAVSELREVSAQPKIEPFKASSLIGESYVLCHLCNLAVSKDAFQSIPVRSYANGLWIGDVPPELQGLTFLEEQCIARARATRCMYKLSLTSAGQFAARGNVCILPQDTSSFLKSMPPPISRIQDEICVILVGSPDVEVTYEMLKRSPLLVRRKKIEKALLWLIDNNPLYRDLKKQTVLENLEEYPEYDCPLPVKEFLRTNSANNQGASYTTYSDQANAELFEGSDEPIELTATTLVDVDSVSTTYRQRKLEALRRLKRQQDEFVKFPSGNMPMSTTKNPRTFGWLWPVLFPYGVGMPDNNNVRTSRSFGFRDVDTAPHVDHLLTIADCRFQVHKAFMFVMNNIMQRRKSSFNSRLAVNRSWFPVIQQLLDKIDEESINTYQAKLDKKESAFPKAETEGEKAAVKLMRYLSYMSEHVPGSVGDVNTMQQQIRSKIMCHGLPHFFATVNPADSHNPIAQVLAGREIDLDKIFHALEEDVKKEGSTRAKVLADNPVAGAEFFHLMVTKFFDIILGVKRVSKIGILGKVKGWYAVVEAQVRGSLHLHVLIWIDGAPASPLDMKERMNSDPEFREKLTAWYDDVICQSFARDTVPYSTPDGSPKQKPVLSRPLDPDAADYEKMRDQHHRDICENCGLVHEHNATCYKHLPRRIQSLADPDEDCRFSLPREEVAITHFDEDDDLVIRCENGHLNGHNPTATLALGCNTDLKQMASGSVAMAMVHYMCNYVAKLQLDTSVVFAALCASIKALQGKAPPVDDNGNINQTEKSRRVMVKATNNLVGKRELTGQQTASHLLGRKNRYTSDEYQDYWWSSMLRDIARDVFTVDMNSDDSDSSEDQNNTVNPPQRLVIPEDEDDSMIILSAESLSMEVDPDAEETREKRYSKLFDDMFYRPPELEGVCVWDIMRDYVKVKKPQSKAPRKTYLRFKPGHSQYTTHCLKKLDTPVIPVLMGYRIPRNDLHDDECKYAVAMLTLFKPWSEKKNSPLKAADLTWPEAFNEFKALMLPKHVRITQNMQLIYQSRDAKFDFSAKRAKRLAELRRMAHNSGINLDEDDDSVYDPVWENAMQATVDPDDLDDIIFAKDTRATRDASEIVKQANKVGFYSVAGSPNTRDARFEGCLRMGDDDDRCKAEIEDKRLRNEKNALIKSRLRAAEDHERNPAFNQPSERIPHALQTTLAEETQKAQVKYEKLRLNKDCTSTEHSPWASLHPYQKLCFALVIKHGLNNEQTRAFLILADKIGRDLESNKKDPPMTLLCTGPGGTGKSIIFRAWKEFYDIIGHSERLRLTAPTGVVASDIGGCTIHSEVSLLVSPSRMKSTPSLRASLEERISPLETLILDEAYFLAAKDIARMSEYLGMATGNTEEICGGLNFATCGDPCQLPPPRGRSLFERELVDCHQNHNLNDLNENVRQEVKGIQIWQQVEHVVVLEENMRQRGDPVLIDILKRLRKGLCTETDKVVLDKYVLTSADCSEQSKALTDINRWIQQSEQACPLIVYTNVARDRHNSDMAAAFASATEQECHVYYSKDMKGRGRKRRQLTGLAAEVAWSVPVKEANDLGGRVPYVPGMPVFCTENIATELGISNGSPGTLVSVIYEEIEDRHYAISADVDFKAYTNSNPNATHPHRVTLKPKSNRIEYFLPDSEEPYHATRWQLPLIPAFAFTSHNAQGRSLDVCCIDLAGCQSIQSAYVMLSRVRSLRGLCILRPFDLSRIRNHISQELRAELSRTEQQAERTKSYSREKLAWFYGLVPDGQVALFTKGSLELEGFDMDIVMASSSGSRS